jgi:D-psicose/D-tagatose/L-ribulose 3-epimerase
MIMPYHVNIKKKKKKMKHYNRRDFIQKSAIALSTIGIAGLPMACGHKSETKNRFKYAFCNEILEDIGWPEQCEIIGNAGYAGVEIAPFTLVEQGVQELGVAKRRQMVQDMKNAGIECSGLHWLFVAPPHGLHFTTPDNNVRQRSVDYLVKLIDFCADMGGEAMIFGSPNQRGTTQGATVQEALNNYIDGLAQVADHAQQHNVKILVEPLPANATDVVNTLSEAMYVVNKIGHPAISTMFDFHNTLDETEPLDALVRKYYDNIEYVHFQNMDGTLVTSDAIPQNFIPVFEVLKEKGYEKWISLEVFDYSPGGTFIANEGMKTFLEIERRIG